MVARLQWAWLICQYGRMGLITGEHPPARAEIMTFGGLLRLGSKAAREKILSALRSEAGNVVKAADRLGVGHRSLCRWLNQTKLRSELATIRSEANAFTGTETSVDPEQIGRATLSPEDP